MEPVEIFLKLLDAFKDKIPAGAGMVPFGLGGALLALTLYMKLGKYHLDKATTLSQIGATAVAQLQASQKLTQEELVATRAALLEANKTITDLIQRLTASEAKEILTERGAALISAQLDAALLALQQKAEGAQRRLPDDRARQRLLGRPEDDG